MTIEPLHFIRPYWLLAFIPTLAVIVISHRNRLDQGLWTAFCDEALLPFLLQQKPSRASRWPLIIGAVAAFLAILALAGPSWERLPMPVFRNASALVIALDLSRSMDAEDIKPSRLIRARYKIADLLKQRKDGQTALLVFAGEAYVVTPLTNDIATIDSQLVALTTDIMPNSGDNAAAALAKAADLLKQAGLSQGQIVLVSDGVETAAAKNALSSLSDHYLVSVLAVGSAEGAPIAVPTGGFLKDERGTIIIPKLDSGGLSELARKGGGIYQALTATDEDIQHLAAISDQARQQQIPQEDDLKIELWEDKGPWLSLVVLPLAALAFRKGLLGMALLSVLFFVPDNSYAFDWQELWLNDKQLAKQAYEQKNYAKAAEKFKEAEWYSRDSDSFYNKGNALAQSGQLREALEAYEKALELNSNNDDAKFNKELVEKELEKQRRQQSQAQNQDPAKNHDRDQSQQQQADQNPSGQDKHKPQQQPAQADSGGKPEQKPERPEKTERPDGQAKQSATEQQEEVSEPTADKGVELMPRQDQQAQQQPAEAAVPMTDEQQQANEQWLKRIPDDPSGLLKRKFKYQYGRQNR